MADEVVGSRVAHVLRYRRIDVAQINEAGRQGALCGRRLRHREKHHRNCGRSSAGELHPIS